jgi:mannose-1-phosphate guanylyltransferase
VNILILAGGTGTRLWPASRAGRPKQLLPFLGNKTLLQNTFARFAQTSKPSEIFIGTQKKYLAGVKQQLPKIPAHNFSLEPVLRDRAPAIGLAALIMDHYQPGSIFTTVWSDHYIKEERQYLALLKKIEQHLKHHSNDTVVVGVRPNFAHTGMGYIELGSRIKSSLPLYKVRSFTEKPQAKTAARYVKSKKYLWNTGYFAWNTTTLLQLFQKHQPEIYHILMEIKPFIGTDKQQTAIDRWYPKMPKVDIENGIVAKSQNRVAVKASFSWADIGSWKVLRDIQIAGRPNVFLGPHLDHGSKQVLVYNYTDKQIVSTLGLDNIAVVVTPEAVLVTDIHRAEEVKFLTKLLEKDPKLKKYL